MCGKINMANDRHRRTVITYGTYDLLHQGHINLLKRARALGDYLIVGVTNDNFDRERGKLNVAGNVMERVEAVRATGLADKIVIEDYVGQKIDDIQRYGVDVFAIGSDWEGRFDYLRPYCEVVYLPRTEGISSTLLRRERQRAVRVGIIGCGRVARRFPSEARQVNGVVVAAVYDTNPRAAQTMPDGLPAAVSAEALIEGVDAVYIASPHLSHYAYARQALEHGRHVLCETPMVLRGDQARELYALARERDLVLMEANKTAYCPAFNHLVVMVKSGVIGEVVDIEASLSKLWTDPTLRERDPRQAGGSMYELGSYPLLPILRLLGTDFVSLDFYTREAEGVDVYTKGVVRYQRGVGSFKLGLGVKTEGDLVVSGTKGYVYVPAPWWKTDYYELRYENPADNKKCFYSWDGTGLRYEIQAFVASIVGHRRESTRLTERECTCMADIMQRFGARNNVYKI